MIVVAAVWEGIQGSRKGMKGGQNGNSVQFDSLQANSFRAETPASFISIPSDGQSGLSCSVCWMKEWNEWGCIEEMGFPAQLIRSSRLVPWDLWFLENLFPWPRNELGKECMRWLQQPSCFRQPNLRKVPRRPELLFFTQHCYSWEPALYQLGKALHTSQLSKA